MNWGLQPDPFEEETPTPDGEPAAAEESTEEEKTQDFDSDAVLARLVKLEEANRQAEAIAADLRRSVGRVQSLVERIDKTSGEARTKLEGELESRYAEMTGLLGEVSGSIDPAILPDSVRQRVNQAQTVAQQRAAMAQVQRLVDERMAAATPAPVESNEIPPAWLAWEQVANRRIIDAGLDPASFDWQVPNLFLYLNQMDKADEYIDQMISAQVPTKVSETKAAQTKSPSAAGAASAKRDWAEVLNDPKVSREEKFKLGKELGLL